MSVERTGPRPSPRCAYCHDDAADAEPCDGCGALVHDECLAVALGCPTLGCPFAAEPAEDRSDPKAAPKSLPVEPMTVEAAGSDLSALGLVRRAGRSDRAPAWWVLMLLAGGAGWWLWTILWPQRFYLDLR